MEIIVPTAVGVIIAALGYVWRERRRRIIKLVMSLEASRARIRHFSSVYEREPVPMSDAWVEVEKAMAEVAILGPKVLVTSAQEYQTSLRLWLAAIWRETLRRPEEGYDRLKPLPRKGDYKVACTQTSAAFEKMKEKRAAMSSTAKKSLLFLDFELPPINSESHEEPTSVKATSQEAM